MGSASTEHRRAKGVATRATTAEVEVDWGTAYELVLGLRMFVDRDEDPESYAAGTEWFERTRELLGPAAVRSIERYSGGHEILFGYLLALAADSPAPRDATAFAAAVERTSAQDLRRLLLGHRLETYRAGVPHETIAAAADGDAAAARELLDGCLDWQREPYEHVLSVPADETKRLLSASCRAWHEAVLRADERSTARLLKSSAVAARALADRVAPDELIDIATRGIRYLPEPGIRRILLVPHIVSRPWTIFTEAGDTKIVCYGLLEAHVTGDAPPDPLVAAYKALGDETRLRILRRLADGPATLHELTELTGLAKSTVHGHLLVLRTGGLVVADVSRKTGYRLRREMLAESAALLESYLQGTEET
jgi:DNA-binding transcriptional ArsR family regulator